MNGNYEFSFAVILFYSILSIYLSIYYLPSYTERKSIYMSLLQTQIYIDGPALLFSSGFLCFLFFSLLFVLFFHPASFLLHLNIHRMPDQASNARAEYINCLCFLLWRGLGTGQTGVEMTKSGWKLGREG